MSLPARPTPPPPPPPPAPEPPQPYDSEPQLPRLRVLGQRLTLSARMVTLVVVVLTIGLALSTMAATAQLRAHMLRQVDEQLSVALRSSEDMVLDDLVRSINRTALESDLQLSLQIDGHRIAAQATREPRWGSPAVPIFTTRSVELSGAPFALAGEPSPAGVRTQWRAVARPVVGVGDRFIGTVVVALPVAPVTQTTSELAKVLAFVSCALVVAAAALGYLAVRRSLRPLREIEATARRITDGDLSSRIPHMPTSTEVGAVAESLNVMLGRIQESFDAQAASEARMRRFVADASHELRTPLVSIRGYAELFRMGAVTTTAQTAETMGRIESSAVQMSTLVEDLLALARLDEQRPVALARVDLGGLAADALADLGAMDPTRTMRLIVIGEDGSEIPVLERLQPGGGERTTPGGVVPHHEVMADEARLRQVFTNLMGNVVRHTPEGSPVEVVVSSDGTHALVAVRDHGPGVPREHREAIFERFHRVDASRNSASGGSGLGLAIVSSIVGAHGGSITASETAGGGATFEVMLPLAT